MANIKISALPSYTGSAADLRWFIMNNSGETETSKFSGYTSQLIPGTGLNSYRTLNAGAASGLNGIAIGNGAAAGGNNSVSIGNNTGGWSLGTDSIAIGRHPGLGSANNTISIGSGAYNNTQWGIAIGHETSAQQNGICIGSNTTRANGSNSVSLGNAIENNIGVYSIVIGYNSRAGLSPTYNGNSYGVIIGSGHRAENTGGYNNIIGGVNNFITGTTSGATLIGLNNYTQPLTNDTAYVNNFKVLGNTTQLNTEDGSNTISGTGQRLVSGSGNTLGGTSTSQFVFGRNNTSNYTPAIGQTGSFVFGENNTAGSGRWGVIMGYSNNVGGTGAQAFGDNHNVSGGNSAVFGNSNSHSGNFGFAAGYANALSGDYTYSFGEDNDITSSSHSSILGGKGNDITNANGYSSLISSSASTITGGTRVVGLGLNGRTGLNQSDTTFTENTHAFRTYSTQVQAETSGTTFTCNLNNGGKAQFYLTGASTIDITNVRDGQSFLIKTQTDGGHTITWTSTGYTFKWKGASSNPGNNKIDLFRFEVFGSVIYGELVSDFS